MRRHTLLFVGAVVLPSLLLLALGLRTIHQEEELAGKRRSEERLRVISLVRQELLTRLEGIALRGAGGQLTPRDREIALVARLESGRLVMPWKSHDRERQANAAFEAELRQAQHQLYRFHDPAEAAARLCAAAFKAQTPEDRARAELLLAVSLSAKGDHARARGVAWRLLHIPPSVVDEYGLPYVFYAARRLQGNASGEEEREILGTISLAVETIWLSPAATYAAAELLAGLQASARTGIRERATALHAIVAPRGPELEQASDLAPLLPLIEKAAERTWILAQNSSWMLGSGKPEDMERVLIVARVRDVLGAIKLPDGMRWTFADEKEGETLGERLRGLKIAGQPVTYTARTSSRQFFYLSAVLLVLSVAIFSAWLLNRDVRRERHLADLQSQFVSSVSHELRTPISTIRTCAELLNMGRVPDESRRSEYLKTIIGESERLGRLVGGVLNFSRMERGARAYHFQHVSLEGVLHTGLTVPFRLSLVWHRDRNAQ